MLRKISLQILYDFLEDFIGISADHRVIAEWRAGNRINSRRCAVATLQTDQKQFKRQKNNLFTAEIMNGIAFQQADVRIV